MLHHFGHTLAHHARRQAREGGGVCQHQLRLVKTPHQVLAAGQVHACLAAYGAVHLGHHGGGYLHKGDAAVVGGSRKACHIAHYAAAEGHHEAAAVVPGAYHFLCQHLDGAQGFVGLARFHDVRAHAVAGVLQAHLHLLAVQGVDVAVRYQCGLAGHAPARYPEAQVAQGGVCNVYDVGAFAEVE